MGNNPSRFKGNNLPVDNVSWNDCQLFIQKLNNLTGKKFRLPTEAEWEYAARGGRDGKAYRYAGSDNVNDVAWYQLNSKEKTHRVKTMLPNTLGLYQMSGNVSEWCEDWYDSAYYDNSSRTNPKGPSSGSFRVYRGGNWHWLGGMEVYSRGYAVPGEVEDEFFFGNHGLRLASDNICYGKRQDHK
jgi:formylglycine-generating enzyme required for sulfatase activity